ncbi:MAG: 3D domain-containing protein [Syntrophomonadaceae bacterium]|nr:3D domain-containing protein [Syntrophomonadaceae bacterium]
MSIVWSKKASFFLASVLTLGLLLGSLAFAIQKPVTLIVDGSQITSRVVFAGTVGDVLKQNQIILGGNDLVEPSQDAPVKRNMQIVVTRAFSVKVTADGVTREIITTPVTVKEAVALAGFTLGENDIVKTLPETLVVPQQEIEVIRVTQKEITVDQEMPYQVEKTTDATLEKGLSKTLTTGRNGVARNTYRVTYYNGQEAKRDIIKMETLVQPVNKVLAMGSITSVSRGGQRFDFTEARYMQATAYTYTGSHTATGNHPAVGMIAVDPTVIPLGSKMYIEGYGYAWAADTGGAIKGNIIDVFLEDQSQCVKWGRKTVKVYILP